MNSRRKFLIKGGMTTGALLVAKPFQTIARVIDPFSGSTANKNKITFLHTGNIDDLNTGQLLQKINVFKANAANLVLLDATSTSDSPHAQLEYDASISRNNAVSDTLNNYRIIYKGNVKTGVISAGQGEGDVIQNLNALATYLKKERNCSVVVCLSQLGYKNKNGTDDITLAGASVHLDLIIGGDTKNVHQYPVVLLNKNSEEVVIHSAAGASAAFGKIDIDFNEHGKKRHISFTDSSAKV